MNILRGLEKSRQFWFLVFTSFLFFLLRLPSLFEPLWYGDEGIYQVIGTALNHGKLLYRGVFDNKPPFLYWLYAIFQSDQFTIRLVSLIFGVLSVIAFFFLARKLFQNKKNNTIPYLTTFIFALLFGLPVFEGNIANAENFMLLPIIVSAIFVVKQRRYFLVGLLLGLAFLFKIVAIFDLGAFLVFCFILNFTSLKEELKLLKIAEGFLLPIFLVSLFFLINGTLIDFIKAAFLTNVSYVSYGNKIGSLPLLLFIKLAILGIFSLFVLVKRKNITRTTLFVSIWFAFSLFNAFFSQRPYTHYLLVLIPSLSLMIGLIFYDAIYKKNISIALLVALLMIIDGFGLPAFNKSVYYYQNLISYELGDKTTTQYQAFFDKSTPFDYEVARFIKPKLAENDTIFLWGNNAQLYQLIGVVVPTKYTVAYHILNYKDGPATTLQGIEKAKPKFIVMMTNSGAFPFPLINYSKKIIINSASIYERLF
jgi:hypothetical protein